MKRFLPPVLFLIILFNSMPAYASDEPVPVPSRQTFTVDGKPADFSALSLGGKNFISIIELDEFFGSNPDLETENVYQQDYVLAHETVDYYLLAAFARENNFYAAYNVDTDAVVIDTSKPWPEPVNEDEYWYGMAFNNGWYADASGQTVARPADLYGTVFNKANSVSPAENESGNSLIIAAQFEKHPYVDVYRITEFSSSPGFPVEEITLLNSGLQFDILLAYPSADELQNAMEPVLNKNNAWSDEFLQRQSEVINVTVNGEHVNGVLEKGYRSGEEYLGCQFIFLPGYYDSLEEIETVRIELNY